MSSWDPQASPGLVLPVAARAAPAHRPGPVRGGDGGLRARCLHPQGRRPGQGARRRVGDLQERGVADLRRARRGPEAFRNRPLDHIEFPYVFLDATYVKGRVRGRVVSRAVVIATGVTATGDREVLGVDVGDSEDGAFWTAFLQDLKDRGLTGVQLVISDPHPGLSPAIRAVFVGAVVATLPCALHAQRARQGPQGLRRHGRRRYPNDLRPTRRRPRPHPARRGRPHARGPVPRGRRHAPRRRRDLLAFTAFPMRTGARSPRRTRSSGSTRRSSAAPTSSASSPTTPPWSASSAPSSSRPHDDWAIAERRYLTEESMAHIGTAATSRRRHSPSPPDTLTYVDDHKGHRPTPLHGARS